ncbi:MAG TPA: cytochrome c oxidase assembly protein [Ktedonobacterales bacterium]|nr:cytochrome c oxidase assembly protein [Ktedonobacterales bacterium]
MNFFAYLAGWQFEPSVILSLGISALLYIRGVVYSTRRGLGRHLRWYRHIAFVGGLLAILIALESPLDSAADTLLWAHMIQHELLVLVAAPLLLLGAPAWPLWRGIPLVARRASLRWVLRQRWPRRLWHAISVTLKRPLVAWVLFNGVFTVWHVPALYDFALDNPPVHVFEHVCFIATALAFWAQVIPSRPSRTVLSYPRQALYLGAAGIVSNVLGSVYIFSTGPLYAHYATLARPAGMMSVLVDQHFGGAAMDIPSMLIFFLATITVIGLWLQEEERAPDEQSPLVVAQALRSSVHSR